ncbi:MAG: ATP-binding cassette domain-containing protein, partial [Marmoricola sp.]
ANGAGKSTLLGLIAGTVEPTSGRVKRGKTVKLGVLDQQFTELEEIAGDRVREVLARAKTSYSIDGRELTPAQLLERLGFAREHLSARVGELSGGQKRRLQLLLVLLSEPNVMILDEPSNDVDTDMLAAMEDLLDSWPGTLIVVSHDRYLVERATDQQYAIIDGKLRHLPGGVDEYLRLRESESTGLDTPPPAALDQRGGLTGAEERAARKELAAAERKLERLTELVEKIHHRMAEHDHTDYEGLDRLNDELVAAEGEIAEVEERWLELSELL